MDPELAQVGSVRLWYYGLAYAIGLLAIHLWVYLRRERLGYDAGRGTGVAKRSLPRVGSSYWAPVIIFYALVVLCLTIPSGWTQHVLQEFETRTGGSSPGAECGGSREEGPHFVAVEGARGSTVRGAMPPAVTGGYS